MKRRAALLAGAVAAASLGPPGSLAHAQGFPTQPRAPDQTLLDWVSPPILKHDIPPELRGDERSCDDTDTDEIKTVALTCWPILAAYKPYLQLEYAATDTIPDIATNRRQALAHAETVLATIGTPRFPLQHRILADTHRIRTRLFEQAGDLHKALLANTAEQAAWRHTPYPWNVSRELSAQADRIRLLLASGERGAARVLLETTWPTLETVDTERLYSVYISGLIAVKEGVESLAIDALRIGDDHYANRIVTDHLTRLDDLPMGGQIGRQKMMALQLFMVVRTGDASKTAAVIDQMVQHEPSLIRTTCAARSGLFPFALAPLRHHPEIANRLSRLNCGADFHDRLAKAQATGVPLGADRGYLGFTAADDRRR